MNGWLLHNHFYYTEKFRGQTELYVSAAAGEGIRLRSVSNQEALLLLPEERPDFVLLLDKDLYLALQLEEEGIPVFNPAEAVRVCDDKMLTYLALQGSGIRMPETISVPFTYTGHAVDWANELFPDEAARRLGYPLVVKQTHGSFGQQVSLAENREQLIEMLNETGASPALLQKYVACSRGTDVRIEVVGGNAVAAMKRTSETDFRANLSAGGRCEPYFPNEEERAVAVEACRRLGLLFAGVDLLFGEDGHPVLCEVNSNAHIRNLWTCTGVNAAEHILRAVRDRLEK